MFVLIYPFTSQIFCINSDTMQKFTYKEKIEKTCYSIKESISHLGKMARTFAKSETPLFFLGSRRDLNQRFPVALTFLSLFHTTRPR